ncbi:hypothetical protein ES332_A10G244000v1 [Gossypium tomentosum]|uniref:Uncharacterized protein n=1 Tax=Gossypium tomentosum TaxID=34277 RepID=A0A5D2NZ95_GOSTO|nr:hypothetical protein ES332_A10G244000v1 [Gossypium tomentosum]
MIINKFLFTLKEREKLLEDMENKITYLQSVISTLKDDSLLADEKLKALQEEVRFKWYVCFGMLHVLESEAQDTEDRVEAVNLKVEKPISCCYFNGCFTRFDGQRMLMVIGTVCKL